MIVPSVDPGRYYRDRLRALRDHIDNGMSPLQAVTMIEEILRDAPLFDGASSRSSKQIVGRDAIAQSIIDAVGRRLGVSPAVITGPRRTKNEAHARHIAIYLIVRRTTLTLSEIGQMFGGRDHSSVLHAKNKIARWVLDNQHGARDVVRDIEAAL